MDKLLANNDAGSLESRTDVKTVLKNIILPSVATLDNIPLSDDSPNVQYLPLNIEMEMAALSNPFSYLDYKGYQSPFASEVDVVSKVEHLLEQGQIFVSILYGFRSVSKAIPEVVS